MDIDIDDNNDKNDNNDNNGNNYVTALLKDSYYFPIKLLVRLDLSQSGRMPNCYLPTDTAQKVPLTVRYIGKWQEINKLHKLYL